MNSLNDKINDKFNSLLKVSSIIISTLNKKDVLKLILEQTKFLMDCSRSSVLLIDEEKEELYFEVCANEEEHEKLKDVRLKKGEGIAGTVWQTKKSIILSNTNNDTRFSKKADQKLNHATQSLIASPLIVNDEVIGVMEAINKIDSDFDQIDNQIFEALANYAAIAIYNARLYEMAICDGLTKLFIHRYFQGRLVEEFKRAKRHSRDLALLMIDIDHFKNFNDSYGHLFGDEVLVKVANDIKSVLRTTDIPARYGGEEFAVILPETNKEGAFALAERLRTKIESMDLSVNNKKVTLTISIGISSIFENNPTNQLELIKLADKALYVSKQKGRNRTTFFEAGMLNN